MKHINSMKCIAALILFLAQAVTAQSDAPFTDSANFPPEQKRLSDRMQEAWVSFAHNGIPSIAGEESWMPVRPGRISIRNFDTTGSAYVSDFADYHKCSFWSSL